METAPLKSFATWARTALIREVTARIAVVLAPASAARVERPTAVEALEKAVYAAGGGEKGKASVADRVAYTWFNRTIALRFMDANGYTGIGVVSPQVGVEAGQPEILAEAKRGNIDTAVVGGKTRETVTGLLNGTRRSGDAQGEAYALLLADYCRHWNRAMPFMFEREGDFTELLIPANLLADDSVSSRAVKVLTKEVCQDVEVIGWLYQFYISDRKDEVFAGFKKNRKAGADEIPAATQLFTPHWIVRYLVENSLGRLWMLNRPLSSLVAQMDYYVAPANEEAGFVKISSPEDIKVFDPACGSGHMLTYTFDLLYAIYEQEGYAPVEIPRLILTKNLYGIEIDPRAGALAAFALTMKARSRQRTFFNNPTFPNIVALEAGLVTPAELAAIVADGVDPRALEEFCNQFSRIDLLGSLIRPSEEFVVLLESHLARHQSDEQDLISDNAHQRAQRFLRQASFLSSSNYDVVVTNPPYMGSRNMDSALSEWLKVHYPLSKQDMYGAFLERALEMVRHGGLVAMITGDSWMTIKTFEDFRAALLKSRTLLTFLHLRDSAYHADTFGANAAFVLSVKVSPEPSCVFVRLEPLESEAKRLRLLDALVDGERHHWVYKVRTDDLAALPGAPLVYQLSAAFRGAFAKGRPLAEAADVRQGMATADNGRFLRLWTEVSSHRFGRGLTRDQAASSAYKWFPYNKGGEFRKWYGNQEWAVNWENDGSELLAERPKAVIRSPQMYFMPSLSWSKIGSGAVAFRFFPQGFLFDVAGTSIFGSEALLTQLAGVLNTSVMRTLLAATSPTLNVEVGTLAQMPILPVSRTVVTMVTELIEMHRADWNSRERSWDFVSFDLVALGRGSVRENVRIAHERGRQAADRARELETAVNFEAASAFGLETEVGVEVPLDQITMFGNDVARFGVEPRSETATRLYTEQRMVELVSYAVGCMFGRYSLDEAGLILADQGAAMEDYLARVPSPTFAPDNDNVIPIVDSDWFEDDVVGRFRTFLRVAFGEPHFEENLRFVTESLGVSDLRDYFVKSFYSDHVQRYKKRPIYWLFSSPKGSFNALIYMHRYTPSTVSTVLNEYLREFTAKLSSSLQQQERLAAGGGTPRQQAAAQKEADRLRKVLLELEEYEHDVLYPLASRQLAIDLDDGVKANYPKFGAALKKIPGLEASE